jgi:hypothetical protein
VRTVAGDDTLVGAEVGPERQTLALLHAIGDIEGQARCKRSDIVTGGTLTQAGLLAGPGE